MASIAIRSGKRTQDYFRRVYRITAGGTAASFANFHKTETARWGAIVKGAGQATVTIIKITNKNNNLR